MNGIDTRSARLVMIGLVGGGVTIAAVGSGSPDPQVAGTLPVIGAAMIAAGIVVLLEATLVDGRRTAAIGGALVAAGVVMAVIGSAVAEVAAKGSVMPAGGALVAAGVVALVRGTAAIAARTASAR